MADLFEHRNGVGSFDRVLAEIDKPFKEFIDISQVEIPRHDKVFGLPVVASQNRVEQFDPLFAERAVSKVPHEEFTGKFGMIFQPVRIIQQTRILLADVIDAAVDGLENICKGCTCIRTRPVYEFMSRGEVEFHAGDAGAVLPAVMLLLHHQVQLL
jgi:hypothetical protein